MSLMNFLGEAIALLGNAEQRRRYLPKFVSGEWSAACFAMTEKEAGSDPRSLQTCATRTDQGYVINGSKQFITNGDLADVCLVFAKLEGAAPGEGVSCFLVERSTPGWRVEKVEQKLGLLTVSLVDLAFENCTVLNWQRLGAEGEGLHIGLSMLDNGRMGIAAQAIGIAEAAFEAALHYSRERQQFGKPIGQHQAVAFKLADMFVKLQASKLLLYQAATLRDQDQPYACEASMAKLFASEAANLIADEALQIHGGYGYVKDLPLERYFRDARVTTIYEGTSEIQRLVISRHLQQR